MWGGGGRLELPVRVDRAQPRDEAAEVALNDGCAGMQPRLPEGCMSGGGGGGGGRGGGGGVAIPLRHLGVRQRAPGCSGGAA
jgi:hypothetical protein